ncbi:MAG: hypothetical protein KBC22_03315 [Candidatus Pacebacteria bacterium]|nr:hypothetical protein [Candidatus Paceibacterota bacterium]
MKYSFEIFADYFAFIVQDENANADFSNVTDLTIENMIDVQTDAINITTARDFTVPVSIEVLESAPTDTNDDSDRINECSIHVPSGTLVVHGNEYFPDAPRITVTPGTYAVRVYYKGLHTIVNDGQNGDDSYHLVLWPTQESLPYRRIK